MHLSLAMRYRKRKTAAYTLAMMNSVMVLGVSLFTDYPGGLWRRL